MRRRVSEWRAGIVGAAGGEYDEGGRGVGGGGGGGW